MKAISNFLKRRDGVTSIEYGILAAGLAVAIATIVADDGVFITTLNEIFQAVVDAVPTNEAPGDGGGGGG